VKTIALIAQKGRVGKTTLAVNLAVAAGMRTIRELDRRERLTRALITADLSLPGPSGPFFRWQSPRRCVARLFKGFPPGSRSPSGVLRAWKLSSRRSRNWRKN